MSESLPTVDAILKSNEIEYYYTERYGHATMPEPAELWLWCQLDEGNVISKHFVHFPHASQALIPCWSWFQKIKRARNNHLPASVTRAHTHCGFYLKDGLGDFVRPKKWISQLIRHMGCTITVSEPKTGISTGNCTRKGAPNCTAIHETLVYRLPFDDYYKMKYFDRPDDAAALRTKILQSVHFADTLRTSTARIAIVDRKRTRRILNLQSMVASLEAAFPNAMIETGYMEDMTPREQFVFWSQHDIIVTGHGAAMTNAIFLPPGNASAVVELFPPHYYPAYFFSNLLTSAGIRGYGYFNGVADYIADHAEHSKTLEDRDLYRNQDLEPRVDAVLDLVRQAMLDGGFL